MSSGEGRARALFRESFGYEAAVVASAPGRVNLLGEHLDYNGGDVLPMAIALRTWVAMAAGGRDRSRVVSDGRAGVASVAIDLGMRRNDWADYVAAPLALLSDARRAGLPAMDIAVWSDVPPGAGLSSSAALEVATLLAARALIEADRTIEELARLAWRAETEVIGVPCGIMDQFASALAQAGQALHLRCADGHVELVPFTETVLVFDTRTPRALRESAYATRQVECRQAFEQLRQGESATRHEHLAAVSRPEVEAARLPEPLRSRALHVVDEMERVRRAVRALREGRPLPGELLFASHESLRDQFDCSSRELDWFVARAREARGVRGARLTGAGWGGCAIAVGDDDALRALERAATQAYEREFGVASRSWLTTASAGARVQAADAA